MTAISDEYMHEMLTRTKEYHVVLLKHGPAASNRPDIRKLVWEHARRNFPLTADGLLSIVCPVTTETGLSGLGIFNASAEENRKYNGWRSWGSGRCFYL